jgi:hypothetical protein
MVCWKAIFDGQDMQTLVLWIDENKQDPVLKEIGPTVVKEVRRVTSVTLSESHLKKPMKYPGRAAPE